MERSAPSQSDSQTTANSLQATNVAGVTITDKTCLIMDEVDGMSAGDRGGVGALNALIKKSKVCDKARLLILDSSAVFVDSYHLHSK